MRKGKRKVYRAYKEGLFIARGTFKEISDVSGLTEGTLRSYSSKSKSLIWDIVPDDEHIDKELVNMDRIMELYREYGYTIPELSEVLEINQFDLELKITGRKHFKKAEIEAIEDLFFLEKDELTKEEAR